MHNNKDLENQKIQKLVENHKKFRRIVNNYDCLLNLTKGSNEERLFKAIINPPTEYKNANGLVSNAKLKRIIGCNNHSYDKAVDILNKHLASFSKVDEYEIQIYKNYLMLPCSQETEKGTTKNTGSHFSCCLNPEKVEGSGRFCSTETDPSVVDEYIKQLKPILEKKNEEYLRYQNTNDSVVVSVPDNKVWKMILEIDESYFSKYHECCERACERAKRANGDEGRIKSELVCVEGLIFLAEEVVPCADEKAIKNLIVETVKWIADKDSSNIRHRASVLLSVLLLFQKEEGPDYFFNNTNLDYWLQETRNNLKLSDPWLIAYVLLGGTKKQVKDILRKLDCCNDFNQTQMEHFVLNILEGVRTYLVSYWKYGKISKERIKIDFERLELLFVLINFNYLPKVTNQNNQRRLVLSHLNLLMIKNVCEKCRVEPRIPETIEQLLNDSILKISGKFQKTISLFNEAIKQIDAPWYVELTLLHNYDKECCDRELKKAIKSLYKTIIEERGPSHSKGWDTWHSVFSIFASTSNDADIIQIAKDSEELFEKSDSE